MSKSQKEIAVETLEFNESMEKVFISPDNKPFVSKNAATNYSVQNKLELENVKEFDRSVLEEETIAEPDTKSDTEPDAEPEAEPIIEPVTKSDTEPDAKPSYEELKKIAAELGFVKKGMPSKVELIEFIESKNQA